MNELEIKLTYEVNDLKKRVQVLEDYIKELQWNIEHKWGLDRMGENNATMYRMISGAYNR